MADLSVLKNTVVLRSGFVKLEDDFTSGKNTDSRAQQEFISLAVVIKKENEPLSSGEDATLPPNKVGTDQVNAYKCSTCSDAEVRIKEEFKEPEKVVSQLVSTCPGGLFKKEQSNSHENSFHVPHFDVVDGTKEEFEEQKEVIKELVSCWPEELLKKQHKSNYNEHLLRTMKYEETDDKNENELPTVNDHSCFGSSDDRKPIPNETQPLSGPFLPTNIYYNNNLVKLKEFSVVLEDIITNKFQDCVQKNGKIQSYEKSGISSKANTPSKTSKKCFKIFMDKKHVYASCPAKYKNKLSLKRHATMHNPESSYSNNSVQFKKNHVRLL